MLRKIKQKFFICVDGNAVGYAESRKDAETLLANVRPAKSTLVSAALPGVDAIIMDAQLLRRDYGLVNAEHSVISLQERGAVCALRRAEDCATDIREL